MQVPEDQIWMIVVGFLLAFVLAFGIGANDVANSFGTSVGSKVLSLREACILATICAKVANTIRKGIVDTDLFVELPDGPKVLMAGQVAALGGACIWMLVATFFRLPVSGTHSIVGATIGFSMIVFGLKAIQWIGLLKIVASWFLSPVLSGITSVAMFYLLRRLVFSKEEQLEPALSLLPAFFGTVILVNMFSIFYSGPAMLHFDKIPLYGTFIISCAAGIFTVLLVKFWYVPRLRRQIIDLLNEEQLHIKESTMYAPGGISIRPTRMNIITPNMLDTWAEHESSGTRFLTSSASSDPSSDFGNTFTLEDRKDKDLAQDSNEAMVEEDQLEKKAPPMRSNNAMPETVEQREEAMRRKRISQIKEADEVDEKRSLSTKLKEYALRKSLNRRGTLELIPKAPGSEHDELEACKVVAYTTNVNARLQDDTSSMFKSTPTEDKAFASLQIVTAVFGSFAHGGNDVSNAIGPLIGLWIIGSSQEINSKAQTPIWILAYGGLGISIGLWIWGRRVIKTMGEDLTLITPSTGVCIEIGSALTVLVASKVGLPISTTHCKVGSVVGVGRARAQDSVNWGVFRNILIAWLVTLPAAGGISALLMYCFTFVL